MIYATIATIGLSASLLILIFPGFELHYLAWIALVPLFLLLKQVGPLRAFLASLAVGFIFFNGLVWWFIRIQGVNLASHSLAGLGNALFFGVFGLVARYLLTRLPRWNVLTFPTTWVLLEYFRSHLGFLSCPWGILGYSQYSVLPVAGLSAFTGVYGVSFLIVTVNTALAEIVHASLFPAHTQGIRRSPARSRLTTSLGVLGGVLFLCAVPILYALPASPEKESTPYLKVALIQGNVYWDEKTFSSVRNYAETAFRTYAQLTRKAADSRPDLIAWPSSSMPGTMPNGGIFVKMLSRLIQETGTFVLVGSSGHDKFSKAQGQESGLANSAFLLSPQGKIIGRYDKIRLLPFSQYLPLRGYVKWPSWLVSSDWPDSLPGKELTIFRLPTARFGVQICWENLFPDQFRKIAAQGVDFMVSMTNEAFIDVPAARYQMLAMNVFRAIENHMAIMRTSINGVSSIILPSGRIAARVQDLNAKDINIEGYLVGEIPLSSARTFYNRYGDWFVYSLLVIFGGFVLVAAVGKAYLTRVGMYEGVQ